jgi:hypothetical protein
MEKEKIIEQGMKSFYTGFAELLKDQLTDAYDQAYTRANDEANKKIEEFKNHAEAQYHRLQDKLYDTEDSLRDERDKNQSLALRLQDKEKVVDAVSIFRKAMLPFFEQLLLNIHLAEEKGENSTFVEALKNDVEQFLIQDLNMSAGGLKVLYSEHKLQGRRIDTQGFELVPKYTSVREDDGVFYRTLCPGLSLNGSIIVSEKIEVFRYRGDDNLDRRAESPVTEEKQYDEPVKNEDKAKEPAAPERREEPAHEKRDDDAPKKREEKPLEYGISKDGHAYQRVAFTNRPCTWKLERTTRLFVGTKRGNEEWKCLTVIEWGGIPHTFGAVFSAVLYLEDNDPYIDVYCNNRKIDSRNLKEIDR